MFINKPIVLIFQFKFDIVQTSWSFIKYMYLQKWNSLWTISWILYKNARKKMKSIHYLSYTTSRPNFSILVKQKGRGEEGVGRDPPSGRQLQFAMIFTTIHITKYNVTDFPSLTFWAWSSLLGDSSHALTLRCWIHTLWGFALNWKIFSDWNRLKYLKLSPEII